KGQSRLEALLGAVKFIVGQFATNHPFGFPLDGFDRYFKDVFGFWHARVLIIHKIQGNLRCLFRANLPGSDKCLSVAY
ncbi:MAG: hypothetical protein OXU22_01980, partial [Gammaproteobacteria bacterium]|nr:hypothetical protein [Gammaproteobacteria bacterium]